MQGTARGARHVWGHQSGTEPKGLQEVAWPGHVKCGVERKVQVYSSYGNKKALYVTKKAFYVFPKATNYSLIRKWEKEKNDPSYFGCCFGLVFPSSSFSPIFISPFLFHECLDWWYWVTIQRYANIKVENLDEVHLIIVASEYIQRRLNDMEYRLSGQITQKVKRNLLLRTLK